MLLTRQMSARNLRQ